MKMTYKQRTLLAHYLDSVNQSVERENILRSPKPTFFSPSWLFLGAACIVAGVAFIPAML